MSGAGQQRVWGFLALLLTTLQTTLPAKEPVPTNARQEEIKAVLRELHRDKQATSSFPEELARRAGERDVQPDEEFVLRREAAILFAQLGLMGRALEQCDRIEERFEIAPVLVRHPVLVALGAATLVDADRAEAVTLLAEHMVACEAAGRPEMANEAQVAALKCAGRGSLRNQVDRAQADRRSVRKVVKTVSDLRAGPMDASASAEAGRLLCLELEQWDDGLPLLAKGGKEPASAVAARDLAEPTGADDQLAVADAWWDLASNLEAKSRRQAQAARRRAGVWYARCERQIPGLLGDVARTRLVESGWRRAGGSDRGGRAVPKGAFDLLGLIDLEKDALAGEWKRNPDGAIIGRWCVSGRLEVPFELPDQYDMTLDLVVGNSHNNTSEFWLILPGHSSGESVMLGFKVNHNKPETSIGLGIHQVNGKPVADMHNPTRTLVNEVLLPKGERRVLRLISRRQNFGVSINDKPVYMLNFGVGGRDLGKLPPNRKLLKPRHLGIGLHWTDVSIHGWHVKPLGTKPGKVGRRLTEDPAALAEFGRGGSDPFQGHVYQQFPIEVSLGKAREVCAALGGSLLAIDSPEEQAFVSDLIKKKSKMATWVDLERGRDGRWVGPNGKAPSYLPFDPKEYEGENKPFARMTEDGQVSPIYGLWYPATIVCEWDAGEARPAAAKRGAGRSSDATGKRLNRD
jgi:hypothetical protein